MMDIPRNTNDNSPAPAFFVVGTVVTTGEGVAVVVGIRVIALLVGKPSILEYIEERDSVVGKVVTDVCWTVSLEVELVPEYDDTDPPLEYPPPLLAPDELPEEEYVVVTVVVTVSNALPLAIKSSLSELPLLKGTVWNACTPLTKNIMDTLPAFSSSSVEDTISLGSKLSGPPYSPIMVVVNSPRGSPLIFATITVPAGAGLPFKYTDP